MKRENLAGLLLLLAAGALYWSNLLREQEQPVHSPDQDPDFVTRKLDTSTYDKTGRLSARIAAASMRHFEDSQFTEFSEPIYFIYPEDSDIVWKLQARQGELADNRHMTLENDVIITSIMPDEPLRTLRTAVLKVDLDTMIVTTEDPLVASGDTFTMEAVGLWADLNTNQVKLLSEVTASYEVN